MRTGKGGPVAEAEKPRHRSGRRRRRSSRSKKNKHNAGRTAKMRQVVVEELPDVFIYSYTIYKTVD
jgi:hypothetical protein